MTALVTGGGRGIGQGVALRLAKAGWHVAIAARTPRQLDETVALGDGKMISVTADVADPHAVRDMVREVEQRLGPISLLVNNAGTPGPLTPFWENDPEEWWRCQEVNLRGPMLCCREVAPGMIARRQGRILNVVSGAGYRAIPNLGAYAVSKAALIRFSEQLALELAPHGISVFPIRPGLVRTEMVEQARASVPLVQKLLDDGLANTPDDVADLVLFLAAGSADALSGCVFSVKEDWQAMVRQAEQVRKDDLYVMRIRQLYAHAWLPRREARGERPRRSIVSPAPFIPRSVLHVLVSWPPQMLGSEPAGTDSCENPPRHGACSPHRPCPGAARPRPISPASPRTRRLTGRLTNSTALPSPLPGRSAARYTPPTALARRPTVMTRRPGGHQAV